MTQNEDFHSDYNQGFRAAIHAASELVRTGRLLFVGECHRSVALNTAREVWAQRILEIESPRYPIEQDTGTGVRKAGE